MRSKVKQLEKQYTKQLQEQKQQLESLQEEKLAIWEQLDIIQHKHQQLEVQYL